MPKTRSRGKAWNKDLDAEKIYELKEGLELMKQSASAKFDETVELAVQLAIDPKNSDQAVRGSISLPAGTGLTTRVCVFAQGELATIAREAGADIVGDNELVEKIEGGFLDFDVVIASPDMMPTVGKLGRVLGPRGLMPNPKDGTVSADIKKAVEDFKSGKVGYRTDKAGNVHMPIGKASFSIEDLIQNLRTALAELVRVKPAGVKGTYLKSINLSSTMGPGIKLSAVEFSSN